MRANRSRCARFERTCTLPGVRTTMMSKLARVLSIGTLAALSSACKKSPPEATVNADPKGDAAATTVAPSASGTANFEESARRALAEIEQQETTKDVTCWT